MGAVTCHLMQGQPGHLRLLCSRRKPSITGDARRQRTGVAAASAKLTLHGPADHRSAQKPKPHVPSALLLDNRDPSCLARAEARNVCSTKNPEKQSKEVRSAQRAGERELPSHSAFTLGPGSYWQAGQGPGGAGTITPLPVCRPESAPPGESNRAIHQRCPGGLTGSNPFKQIAFLPSLSALTLSYVSVLPQNATVFLVKRHCKSVGRCPALTSLLKRGPICRVRTGGG